MFPETFVKDQNRPYQKLLEILNLEGLDKKEVFKKLQLMRSEDLLRADETLLMVRKWFSEKKISNLFI